jgi:ubiquinone/menaquinone biosynthesis C-methylase UbiE
LNLGDQVVLTARRPDGLRDRQAASYRPTQWHSATRRQRWAVETMAVAPGDLVLEIGSGRGVAVSLVAERLTTGKIVAIDRSATMARLTSEHNERHIRAGRVEVLCTGFESAEFPADHLTKIFTVNVNLFWLDAATQQIDRMRSALKPDGELFVFGERPRSASTMANLAATERALQAHGFDTVRKIVPHGRERLLTCVIGTVAH